MYQITSDSTIQIITKDLINKLSKGESFDKFFDPELIKTGYYDTILLSLLTTRVNMLEREFETASNKIIALHKAILKKDDIIKVLSRQNMELQAELAIEKCKLKNET